MKDMRVLIDTIFSEKIILWKKGSSYCYFFVKK